MSIRNDLTKLGYDDAFTAYNALAAMRGLPLKKYGDWIFLNEFTRMDGSEGPDDKHFGWKKLDDDFYIKGELT